ncbi:MAG: hypothetical protein ACRDZQ_13735, partial [Acidimicrobiales bacterium]
VDPGPAGGRHPSLDVAWRTPSFGAGPPIVAGSTVWLLDPRAGDLLAFDATTGSRLRRLSVGSAPRFTTPAAAGRQVYVVAGGRLSDVGS